MQVGHFVHLAIQAFTQRTQNVLGQYEPLHTIRSHSIFADFHLQGGSSCRHDSLDIYDGASIRDAKLGRFCGQNKPMLLTSSGNYFYLRFKSDGTTEKRGFRATYNTTQGKLH